MLGYLLRLHMCTSSASLRCNAQEDFSYQQPCLGTTSTTVAVHDSPTSRPASPGHLSLPQVLQRGCVGAPLPVPVQGQQHHHEQCHRTRLHEGGKRGGLCCLLLLCGHLREFGFSM